MSIPEEKLIIVTSDDNDEDFVVAVFTSPMLAKEFLNRPLAKGRKYVVTECLPNPNFSRQSDNIYNVIYDPHAEEKWMIEQIYAFMDEADALESRHSAFEGRFFVTAFGKNEDDVKMQVLAMYDSLVKSGEWDRLNENDEDFEEIIDPLVKYKNWEAPAVV